MTDNRAAPDDLTAEHRNGLHHDAYAVDCPVCQDEEAPFDAYRQPEGGEE